MGDAERGIAEPSERLRRRRSPSRSAPQPPPSNGTRAAANRPAVWKSGMSHRNDARPPDIVAEHEIDAAEKGIALGQDHALGAAAMCPTYRAGSPAGPRRGGRTRAAVPVIAFERGRDSTGSTPRPAATFGEFVIVKEQLRAGVGDQGGELDRGEPPVQWHEHSAGADAAELQDQHLRAIAGEHGDPLAARRAEPCGEPGGGAVRSPVERGIGPAPAALQIGDARARPAGSGQRSRPN